MSSSKSHRRRPRKKKSHKKIIVAVGVLAIITISIVVASLVGIGTNNNVNNNNSGTTKVRLVTNMGNIVIELRDDMPITTTNFKNLVAEGMYGGTIFHRVVDSFVIQGGEVNSSVPSIPSEIIPSNNRNDRGTVAMALKGNPPDLDSASSQFFINLVNNNDLDDNFAVFGEVIEGMDVVDQIAKVPTDANDKPIDDVTIFTAVLEG